MASPIKDYSKVLEVAQGLAGTSGWTQLGVFDKDDLSINIVEAITGGDKEYTLQAARSGKMNGKLVGVHLKETGAPSVFETTVQLPKYAYKELAKLRGKFQLRIRHFAGNVNDMTIYERIDQLVGAVSLNDFGNDDVQAINDQENSGDYETASFPVQAVSREKIRTIRHSDIKGAVIGFAINKVISYDYEKEAGQRGEVVNSDGNQIYIAVTDKDGSNLPHLLFTLDGGANWTDRTLTGLTNMDAVDVTVAGGYVWVAGTGTGGGVAYAKWSDVLAGAVTPTRVTGIASGDVCNCLVRVSNSYVYVGENSGIIDRIDVKALSASVVNNAATTSEHILAGDCRDEDLVWFGAASGDLVKLENGAYSLVAVTGTPATNFVTIVVPPGLERGEQVFIGDSGGNIYKTIDAGDDGFTQVEFDGDGAGTIADIGFGGAEGCAMFVVQTNGSAQSRVLLDLSGGHMGTDVKEISTYTGLTNGGMNSIAVSDVNTAVAVGEVTGSYGFIGRIAPAA